MFRFQSGWTGEAWCGVWQKMQTSCSLEARIAPGPEADRFGLLFTMLLDWPRAVSVGESGTAKTSESSSTTGIGFFMAGPPAGSRTPGRAGYNNRRPRFD